MAIDRHKTEELLDSIDSLFDSMVGELLPSTAVDYVRKTVMGPALDEIRKLVDHSRPPVLFLAGRSGHGKSSLVNALTGQSIATIGDIKPTTPNSTAYDIKFPEQFSSWKIIDSRGIFETTQPEGAPNENPKEVLYQDILQYTPDIILHVISAPEIRSMSNDLEYLESLRQRRKKEDLTPIPIITVLSKIDVLGNPREWPPELNHSKIGTINDALDYLQKDVMSLTVQPIIANETVKGLRSNDPMQPGIIPVCSLEGELWNIETLQDFIGKHLPESSLLEYYQALRRQEELRNISSALIKRFSVIASGIGAAPTPMTDFIALVPLQFLMIAMIGGLSCKPVSKETAMQYLSAAGLNLAATGGLRYASRQLLKLIPFGGWAAAGTLAGSGTWALGKAAETWFFSGNEEPVIK